MDILAIVRQRLANLFARGILKALKVSGAVYTAQVDLGYGERRELPVIFPFGFASAAPASPSTQGFAVFPGGTRDNGRVWILDCPKGRPALQPGEAALHNAFGQYFKIDKDGKAWFNGELHVTKLVSSGDVEASGDVKAGATSLKNHKHLANGGTPPLTAPPGGGPVTGQTGAPT